MLNQQQDEQNDQHQADNAARTVPPAPAPGESADEEDDQQDEKDGGKHDGTPGDLRITRKPSRVFRLRPVHADELHDALAHAAERLLGRHHRPELRLGQKVARIIRARVVCPDRPREIMGGTLWP